MIDIYHLSVTQILAIIRNGKAIFYLVIADIKPFKGFNNEVTVIFLYLVSGRLRLSVI